MNKTLDIDSFNDCWIKALLYYVCTKDEVISISRHFQLISQDYEDVLSKTSFIELIFTRVPQYELISMLQSIVLKKGMPDLYAHLKTIYGKISTLEPEKLANIYVHITNSEQKDMAAKVVKGLDLEKVFNLELTTLIFREVFLNKEDTPLRIVEYMADMNGLKQQMA